MKCIIMSRGINTMLLIDIFDIYIAWVKLLPHCGWIINYGLVIQKQETLYRSLTI